MIGVTVVTPSYRHLEKEAIQRFKKFSGIKQVKVIRCKDSNGFHAKLDIDKHVGRERVVFFDIDWWMLRHVDFQSWCASTWFAVHDSAVFNEHAFPHTDCRDFSMNSLMYFNSGFMVFNLALKSHRDVFKRSRLLLRKVQSGSLKKPTDVTDQFYINLAAQQLRVPVSLTPTKFNFYMKAADWGQLPFIPRDIVGIHAAGCTIQEKHHALKVQSEVFGRDIGGLLMPVMAYDQTRIFEFR